MSRADHLRARAAAARARAAAAAAARAAQAAERGKAGAAKARQRAEQTAANSLPPQASQRAQGAVRRLESVAVSPSTLVARARRAGPKRSARKLLKWGESAPGVEETLTFSARERGKRARGFLPRRAREAAAQRTPTITVVVIVYNMSKQAARTLYTLSAAYQRGVHPSEYEVLVVENSSDDNLSPAQVRRMGPNFRYHRRTETGVTPAPAINVGLELARGQYVGLMVDGARMVTPGVIRNALDAFRISAEAVVAVPGYHIGFSDHMDRPSSATALRQDRRLLAGIPWRSNGYSLFDIGILSGANPFGFLHPMGESNCMFASQEAYARIGGADLGFDLPGGGMVNLDMYRELLRPESARLILLPGEGTFHQFHGGVTTQHDAEREELMAQFRAQYESIRGEPFHAPRREPYLLGEIPDRGLPVLFYSAWEAIRRFENWNRWEPPESPWVDDAVVLAPDILNRPPRADRRENGVTDVSIYLPPSITRFEPKHMVFSTWMDHIQFGYDLVAAIRPSLLVELGTQGGMSYFTFCQSMRENDIEGLCYAVDTWEGEEHTGKYDDSTWEMVSRVNREGYLGFSYLMRMFFNEAAEHFDPDTIDLLHIDGLHTYDAVREDFETWYPKVKPGGIILFHDIRARLKDFGVWRYWDEVSQEYPSFAFNHGFGLGVIQKPGGPENTSELVRLMFDSTPEEQAQLRRFYEHAAYFHHVKRRSDQILGNAVT